MAKPKKGDIVLVESLRVLGKVDAYNKDRTLTLEWPQRMIGHLECDCEKRICHYLNIEKSDIFVLSSQNLWDWMINVTEESSTRKESKRVIRP